MLDAPLGLKMHPIVKLLIYEDFHSFLSLFGLDSFSQQINIHQIASFQTSFNTAAFIALPPAFHSFGLCTEVQYK